tara:strand:- start:21296 stop:21994 length:699 start_codon:yes stop_codon:yes gene_type:complete
MEQNFKYPMMRTFYDVDNILCVFVEDVINAFPNINKISIQYMKNQFEREFGTFSWDIRKKDLSVSISVMAFDDLKLFIERYKEICVALEVDDLSNDDLHDYESICKCSVSGKLLLADDEAYGDENTGEMLSTEYSVCNDESGNYVKFIDGETCYVYNDSMISVNGLYNISCKLEKGLWYNEVDMVNHKLNVNFYSREIGTATIWYDDEMDRRPYIIVNNTITYLDTIEDKIN